VSALDLRALTRVHGGLAWASIAVLAAALFAVWKRRPAVGLAASAAVLLGSATFVTGALLHGPFQSKLRQRLFLEASTLGWLFERKEHVAFGGLALSCCALSALWAERLSARGDAAVAPLRRVYLLGFGAAFLFEAFAAAVSIAASRHVGF
jgi:hypothetical protein